jgi:hypothetical protein
MLMKKTAIALAAAATMIFSCLSPVYADSQTASKPPANKTQDGKFFTEPFSYCKCTGTIDMPDDRYMGEKIPDAMIRGIRKTMNLGREVPADYIKQTTLWRCMESRVYICMVGANLPCQEKADLTCKPSDAMVQFCRANPGQDYIPAYVTGRATVYEWRCSGKEPVIAKQLSKPDARGFISDIWFELPAE